MIGHHIAAWPALLLAAIINGTVRELGYGRHLPELAAHQLSTATAIVFTGLIAWLLARRWPLQSTTAAGLVGAGWLALTTVFEFTFGHFVMGQPWARLWQDFDLAAGRLWGLFLVWILVVPYAVYRLQTRRRR